MAKGKNLRYDGIEMAVMGGCFLWLAISGRWVHR